MAEIPHCELEKYHNEAIRNNLEYRIMYQMEVMREEIMMHLPRTPIEETEQNIVPPKPPFQIDITTQLWGQVQSLESRLNEHLKSKTDRKRDKL